MAYKLVETVSGYLPLHITGDGLIIAKAMDDSIPLNEAEDDLILFKFCKKIAAAFKKADKERESRLFATLANLLLVGVVRPQDLIGCGFSYEFAEAWIMGEKSGMCRVSLLGVEKVAGTMERISEEQFEENLAKMFSEQNKK